MKIVRASTELPPGRTCIGIGVFDGVHLGHQQIIRQTISAARQQDGLALIVTFDRHPNAVVAPEHVPPLIYSAPQKYRAIAALGADALLEIPFTPEFSRQTGEQFIRQLTADLQSLGSICVGADFVFGQRRSGNVPLLRQMGAELHFRVHGLAAVALDGETVSSTRIRDSIRRGDFDAASQMLGRAYSLAGIVQRGNQLGRQLGFPTANLDTTGMLLPPNGVYTAHALLGSTMQLAVVNIGQRPTLDGPANASPQVEVHLLDFAGELYGQELEITLGRRLRGEQKFPTLAALRAQIQADIEAART